MLTIHDSDLLEIGPTLSVDSIFVLSSSKMSLIFFKHSPMALARIVNVVSDSEQVNG